MAIRQSLPYFAPADLLPAPLPSVATILASTHRFFSFNYTVVRVGEHFVVKHGPNVRLQEGENMLFIQQATSIRVPTLYALFHDDTSGHNFIVQEYISGVNVFGCWRDLDTAKKENVAAQLQCYFGELRGLSSPGYFCGVWEQDIIDFWCIEEDRAHVLPKPLVFRTEEQWNDAMLATAQAVHPIQPQRFAWMRRAYRTVLRDHSPVFTHGDLDPKNILIQDDGTVVLIDWQRSGWYPSYWEFCSLMVGLGSHDSGDWDEWIPRFLTDEYFVELGWVLQFYSWFLWGGG